MKPDDVLVKEMVKFVEAGSLEGGEIMLTELLSLLKVQVRARQNEEFSEEKVSGVKRRPDPKLSWMGARGAQSFCDALVRAAGRLRCQGYVVMFEPDPPTPAGKIRIVRPGTPGYAALKAAEQVFLFAAACKKANVSVVPLEDHPSESEG